MCPFCIGAAAWAAAGAASAGGLGIVAAVVRLRGVEDQAPSSPASEDQARARAE